MNSAKQRKFYTPTQTALADALVNRQFTCSCGGKFQTQGLGGKTDCKVLQAKCGSCKLPTSQTDLIKIVYGTHCKLQATLQDRDQRALKALLEKAAAMPRTLTPTTTTRSNSSSSNSSSSSENNNNDHDDSNNNNSSGSSDEDTSSNGFSSPGNSHAVSTSPLECQSLGQSTSLLASASPHTPQNRRLTLMTLSPIPRQDEGDEEEEPGEMEEGEMDNILSRSTAALMDWSTGPSGEALQNCSTRSPGEVLSKRDQQTLVHVLGQMLDVQANMRAKMVEMEKELKSLKTEILTLKTHPQPQSPAPQAASPPQQRQPQQQQRQPQPQPQRQQQKEKAREEAPRPQQSPNSPASPASPSAARTRQIPPRDQQRQSGAADRPPSPSSPHASPSPSRAAPSLSPLTPHGRSLTVRQPGTFTPKASAETIKESLRQAGIRLSAMTNFAMNGKELRILARSAPAAWAIRCRLLDSSRSCLVRMLTSQEEKTIFSC